LHPALHNVIIRRTTKGGKIKIENVPPEEFLIERTAKSIEDANFVAHRTIKTRSELIQMGYDAEIVNDLPATQIVLYNNERLTRFGDIDEYPFDQTPDSSTESIELYECYVKVDYDGDGVAELRKVTVAGDSGYQILDNEVSRLCSVLFFNSYSYATPILWKKCCRISRRCSIN
jgi:hypothetical protein